MKKIGKYVIETPLLDTSFSDIYIARDPAREGYFALKVFHPKGSTVGTYIKRGDSHPIFRNREAKRDCSDLKRVPIQ